MGYEEEKIDADFKNNCYVLEYLNSFDSKFNWTLIKLTLPLDFLKHICLDTK